MGNILKLKKVGALDYITESAKRVLLENSDNKDYELE